jgi:hypothetical protein
MTPYAPAAGAGVISHMQGVCRGRAGRFPTHYVREMDPPVFRNLATPFNPVPTPARNPAVVPPPAKPATTAAPTPATTNAVASVRPATAQAKCGNWGCGKDTCDDCRGDEIVVSRSRQNSSDETSKQQHVRWGTTSWNDIEEGGKTGPTDASKEPRQLPPAQTGWWNRPRDAVGMTEG